MGDKFRTVGYFAHKFGLNLYLDSPIHISNINRKIMAMTLGELGFTVGAEVGVAAGDHSKILLESIPDLELHCVDPWIRLDRYRSYSNEKLQDWFERAKANLSGFEKCKMIRKSSMDAVLDFKDSSLDFVYIDGAHDFKNIAMDICEWIRKVKSGGVLFGHDYTRIVGGRYPCHVMDVVNAYAKSYAISPWFILGEDGNPDGLYREGQLSWMYVV